MKHAISAVLAHLLLALPVQGFSFFRSVPVRTLSHGGLAREYLLLDEAPKPRYANLVLALHGGGGRARGFLRFDGQQFRRLADESDSLVVFPQGIERFWNCGPIPPEIAAKRRAYRDGIDDIGFLAALIAHLCEEFQIPPQQVFVCGISNGGRMTLRLLLERPDLVRAAGVVIMGLSPAMLETYGIPDPPVPVLFLSGTADPLVPFEGGDVHFYKQKLGVVLGAKASLETLAEGYGCRSREDALLPDRDPEDGTRSRRWLRRDCRQGAEVGLVESQGGGHAWPGGHQYLPKFMIGPVVRDFDAADEFQVFWGRHGLRPRQRPEGLAGN